MGISDTLTNLYSTATYSHGLELKAFENSVAELKMVIGTTLTLVCNAAIMTSSPSTCFT